MLIVRTTAQNPYLSAVRKVEEKLRANPEDRDDIQMVIDGAQLMAEEWHGKNVFPIEAKLAKLKIQKEKEQQNEQQTKR